MLKKGTVLNVFFILIFVISSCSNSQDNNSDSQNNNDNPNNDMTVTTTTPQLSISKNDITWTFDQAYPIGQFANGDYFVVSDTGINITGFSPESIEDGGGNVINGSMINPEPTVHYQGFDENIVDFPYSASLNVAWGVNAENPLPVSPESSVISTISRIPDTDNHSYVQSAEILTVLSSVPEDGSFRPPYAGSDKIIVHVKSELNYDMLLSLDPVDNTPDLANVEDLFERPWIEFNTGPICCSIHPADNMEAYGRDIAADIGVGALTLNLDYSDAQKEKLLIYFIQLGLDYYGIIQNGGEWEANGGHEEGRKWPALFAAMILDDSTMIDMFAKTGDYLYDNGYYEGNQPPDYISFGEDDQTFYVTQRDIDRVHTGTDYAQGDLGLAEWGISHNLSPAFDSNVWDTPYRLTSFTGMSGHILSALIMGSIDSTVRTIWNHDAIFDYMYRFMDISNANDTFTQNMWDTYIDDYYYGPYY